MSNNENNDQKVIYIVRNNNIETIKVGQSQQSKKKLKKANEKKRKNRLNTFNLIATLSLTLMAVIVSIAGAFNSYQISKYQYELDQAKYELEILPVFTINKPYNEIIDEEAYEVYEIVNSGASISDAEAYAESFFRITIYNDDIKSEFTYGLKHYYRFENFTHIYNAKNKNFLIYKTELDYNVKEFANIIVNNLSEIFGEKYQVVISEIFIIQIKYMDINRNIHNEYFKIDNWGINRYKPTDTYKYEFYDYSYVMLSENILTEPLYFDLIQEKIIQSYDEFCNALTTNPLDN